MVSISFVVEKENGKTDYIINNYNLKNTSECSLCRQKVQQVYILEIRKNDNLKHLVYCNKCFDHELKFIKHKIYNANWNKLIFMISDYRFVVEKTNLTKNRCDYCYSLYTKFKIMLYPIALENKLCTRCFKQKLEKIILNFEKSI
jgi:protein-arginine kinase activator protein McsA